MWRPLRFLHDNKMVTRKETHYTQNGDINPTTWLSSLHQNMAAGDYTLLKEAFELAQHLQKNQTLETGFPFLTQSIHIAEILSGLNLDSATLTATILMYFVKNDDLSVDDILTHYNRDIYKLIQSANKISNINLINRENDQNTLDNLRKMILAMVDDVRVVFIKLAEQLFLMRSAMQFDENTRKKLSQLSFDVYAPLANRLGIGQIKWELEDLAFRYLEPEKYKAIVNALDEKRINREHYVENIIHILDDALKRDHIGQFEITGRVKHIYSIYKKMQRKAVGYEKIYDVTAVRILTENIPACYAALSAVHDLWHQISEEFDDYIANPKPNGYRSIHTAVIGPLNKSLEVQIRTFEMHHESELGVAAHWKYKEGMTSQSAYEEKILWLRQLLAWQQDLSDQNKIQSDIKHLFSDRVYVLTPKGDVMELPQGSTPLDFAYQIHTQIGHRCKGAKINGHIAPLTTKLKTGDKINVLTGKKPNPSRDWLNVHAGYLATNKARSKVFHWFKAQDHDLHVTQGKHIYEREAKHLKLPQIELLKLAKQLHYKSTEDMFAALGQGEIKHTTFMQAVHTLIHPLQKLTATSLKKPHISEYTPAKTPDVVKIGNIHHLLNHTAKCCKPLPGDEIIGFITRGRGISIHRADCQNIIHTTSPERLMPMTWEEGINVHYPVDLQIQAEDREGLVRDITTTIANEKIKLLNINTAVSKTESLAIINLTIEMYGLDWLKKIIEKLSRIPDVMSVKRKTF